MILFIYDHTFEGLLTCIFDAYFRKTFPDLLLMEGEPLPLFYNEAIHIATDEEKAGRVWRGLQKKISKHALFSLTCCWLSELPKVDEMLFHYIGVDGERVHLMQFVRFQKAADGTFFAAVKPQFNALPLAVDHFKDRFADQRWLIYDVKRQYGYYYNLTEMEEVTFEDPRQAHLVTGMLNETLMDNNERLFQELWKTYFKSICIKERWNPQKHRQDMPVRYWKYLTEKQ